MIRLLLLLLYLILPIAYAQQTLIIGTTSYNPPFNSLADSKDHFYGFDIDIMENICHRLNFRCQFTPFVFDELFSALKNDKINLAIAAIIITPDREQEFLFSIPYLKSQAQFITTGTSPIQNKKDILNKKIGARKGTPFGALALNLYNQNVTIVEMPNDSLLLEGLYSNSINVVLADAWSAKNWVSNTNNLYKLIGEPMNIGNGYGIMTNLGQDFLMAKINQALLSLEADGTYLTIYNHYFSE